MAQLLFEKQQPDALPLWQDENAIGRSARHADISFMRTRQRKDRGRPDRERPQQTARKSVDELAQDTGRGDRRQRKRVDADIGVTSAVEREYIERNGLLEG